MFENPRRGREARNFTTNVPKILVLKSSSEQIFSRILPLGAPDIVAFMPRQIKLILWDKLEAEVANLIRLHIQVRKVVLIQ